MPSQMPARRAAGLRKSLPPPGVRSKAASAGRPHAVNARGDYRAPPECERMSWSMLVRRTCLWHRADIGSIGGREQTWLM